MGFIFSIACGLPNPSQFSREYLLIPSLKLLYRIMKSKLLSSLTRGRALVLSEFMSILCCSAQLVPFWIGPVCCYYHDTSSSVLRSSYLQ